MSALVLDNAPSMEFKKIHPPLSPTFTNLRWLGTPATLTVNGLTGQVPSCVESMWFRHCENGARRPSGMKDLHFVIWEVSGTAVGTGDRGYSRVGHALRVILACWMGLTRGDRCNSADSLASNLL